MAERPLYTLYKNLKAQNYDVPDDYNKFESALTRDGKGGADNRHAIYENLKAQNFDVPSTYERFYSALFEPRSRTSSRAKGGSVPMSDADRARFLAGAQSVLNTARQVKRASGNIRKTVERAKKFNANDGKVTIGFKNPLQNQNVQKNEFNYNSTTGKTGTYTTTDGVEFDNEYDASHYQNQLDKQGQQYINAVNAGEIPSAFDVRDKKGNYDLQENIGKNGTYLTEDGAQKQFDKKLADAYARKKEIEALIAEDNRQHGNPLLSYGASIGASNGRTAEQSDYRNKLATSLSLVTEQIGALEAVKQYPTSSWGEDALKALDNTAFTAKTWDFGLTDFAIMGQMERIKTKMDNNIPLSGSDKMLLKSKLGADAATALEDDKMGNVYRWTKIAGQSLPFMADFFLTGGYGGITKGISRGALKFAAKRGMGKVSAAILKNTGIVAGDVIGSYAMAGTEQALKTGADIMQRHLGNLYQDEKGDYKFGTFDENGNLLHEGGESIGTALYKGMTSAMVENYTEKLFGHNYGIKKGAVNFMEKHGMNASAEFFKNIGKSGWYTNSKKWMEKFGINGFAEEVMEEEIGIPLHALLDGEGKVSDILDARQQLDIIGGMAISVGSMYAMGAGSRPVKGIYNRAQYYRFRNKVNVADIDAQNLMGDNWADIKDKIDNATNEQMGGVLADILRQRDTMTKEQINAAVNYGINLMKMRGYNIAKTAEMNAKEITNEPTTPEEQHQADIDNAYSEGHDADDADKHDIQIQQEDQMKTLAAALGISEQQLSAMSDEELESMTGQDDKLDQAIYDYQLSSARYQGVVDDAQDKVDLAAHQAEQRVDMYTDQSRGSVRNATIKASGGLEDYGVYIISGNIATHDDGSIDVSNSDDMILYYDPTTNSVEHADALMFAELGEELPADDVKAQAVSDAKENAIKEVAGIIDGTVEVGSQFNVTDTDGTEHTYEVLADYGDGTAAISIDGNVVENPYSLADLQQMKDLEDQKRLEAAKAEREQMEKEREAQQTQNIEETQPSFDFNQILNDNGNVVLADVLGKDGNTKYPNSQLFLIRDSGAKAKVMELTSDGSLIPHAVNKKDVRTATTMTLDEYKQAFAESSMIEDNSGENRGEIEVETPTIEGETAAPADETAAPESAETPATEQTPAAPAITLEDGTIVPMLEDGNPDFSKLTAAQTAELYDTQFGEDADSIVSGYVSDAKKALDKASNMTVKGKTFVEQKAAKDAKEKAIADAKAAYDSAIAIRDAYNERQLAKVEDTAEGRKELIEKARRKFARLKSAVKDDAEAVAQIYKETVGTLLHRLYDGTGIDVTDTIPLTAEEYVASNLGAHSLNYEGTETSKGVKQETGLSREDFAKTQLLAADGKGTTIDALVHSLWENRPSNLESLDTQDIRNALIGVLNSGFKASEARNFVENIRIAQAENILEEQKRAQENAAYAEQHKAEPEAELKAKSDEKAELKAKSEAKLDNESDNKSNDLSNESDNEKINDNINDNINVPEDATDEAPLGAQRDESDLPFSAKENGKQQTTAERAADVEKNKVDDMKVVDNIVGEKTRKAFERLSKMMGATIQWQYSDKLGNGWIQETTDADGNVHRTIFITLDSSITEGAQFIFGHEMTHQIKNLNPAAYNELTQLVLDTYGSDAFDKAVDETMQRYSDAGFSGRAREYYAEEVVADSVGEMIRDLNLAHTLAMKMSHPLLAAIHEILQKIKLAFFGTEYSDVTKNIIRSIEQAYVKTANGEVTNSETGEDVSFSLRQKPEPKKKGVGYKVFVLKDGKLYPPMVANPDGAATPVGVWLDADAAPIAGESKTGRPQVKQGGKGTQGGSGKLAYRPGWHLGIVPYAIQFNRKDADGNKTLFPKNFVFAEVEYAADVDYQEEARQEGINPSGKYQHSLAGLKHLPTDGYYMYRTNPNPETDPWVITGAMKVNRILTRAEQAELVKNAGREPQQIQEGDIVTDDVVNSINQEIADAPKFSIKTYHGSQASFDKFDHSFMGSGEGAQAYGWGTYVSEVEGIAKAYAKQNTAKRNTEYTVAKRAYEDAETEYKNLTNYIADSELNINMYNIPSLENNKKKLEMYKEKGIQHWVEVYEQRVERGEKTIKEERERIEEYKLKQKEAYKLMDEAKKKLDSIEKPKRNLYSVDIPDDTGRNYIGWDEPLGAAKIMRLPKVFKADGWEYKKVGMYDTYKIDGNEHEVWLEPSLTTGKELYRDLTNALGSDKAASEFLSKAGFVGVKVIALRNAGGNKEGKMNYVIFDENNAQITSHTKFSLKKVNDAFNQRLDELVKNPNQKDKILRLGRSSSFLKAGGIADAEIELDFDKLMRKSKQGYVHEHPFDATDVKDLPMAIANPISVFDNTNGRNDGQVILTELKKEDRNFIVAIQTENQNRKGGVVLKVNKIVTLFPKDARGVINWFNQGKATNIDKEKALHFIEALQNHSGTTITDEELKSAANIINSFETTKENGEKVDVDGTKFSLKDEEYLKAVEDGNMEKAQKMVNEAADAAGYSTDSSYQGTSAFNGAAPWGNGYFLTKDERKEAWDNGEFEGESTLGDYINDDIDGGNLEELTNAASYRAADPMRKEAIDNVRNAIQKKAKTITMYRSVPSDVKEGSFRNGDWVTPSRAYAVDNAKLHGWGDDYNIIEQKVPVDDVWFDGNDIAEWGYGREEDYINDTDFAYKNSKNNKKLLDAVTYDDNGNVIPLSQRFNEKNKDVRFSLKDEKTLVGVHNISEEKLLKAIKQGGLANPSVAVIDSSRQDHKAYGGISLIMPSDKIAKRTGKNAGTWQGDAYTPTYPQVERQMSNKGAEKASKDVSSVPSDMYSEVRRGLDRWLDGGEANSAMAYMFLHEKGVVSEPKKIQPKFSDEAYNELKFITAGDFNIYGIGKADAQKVLDMYIEAKFDGDKDLYEEKTKAWLERNKSIVDAGAKGGMRYAIAKENVELYDEYGFNYKGVQSFVRDVEYDHRKTGVDTDATLNEVENYIKTNNLTDEFNTWLEGKEKEYGIKEVIFDGFTPSGNRRYVPNTLENVSKIMKKQGRNGATGAAVSFQNFAARLMPSYGTLNDIRSKRDLLTSDREKFDKFREKWSNVFFELGMKCQPDATGTFADYGLARLSEAAMTSDPQAYLKKEYNVDFSDEDTKRLKEMVKAIKEEHPAMYFETKFERPVSFDEFSAAVVPTTTKKEVKDVLKNAGVSIFEYDEKSDADRSRAFNEAINSSDNIRFSLAGERGAAAADKAEERTFRMDNLSVAKDMEKNKKKAKAIKAATGWERGADGKWRYEMPDVVLRDPKEWVNNKTLTLSDIVEKPNDLFKEYPELFDAYPKLKDVKIQKGRAKMGGSYYDNTITLNLGGIREAIKYDLDIHYKIATRLLKRTLVHEVQHYIQHEEGFAKGGSEQFVRDAIKDEFEKVIKQIRGLRAEGKEDEAKALAERNKALYNAYANEKDSYKNYKSLSGEVEARNVSARLNMTPEERRKTLAESTEDVARKDQIFLGVGDVSFSLRDMADGKESGAADMAEDLKSLNTPDEVDDAIKTAIDDMPSGWQMANKKMIHIVQALGENRKAEIAGEEPKFSLKDGTLIKAGTYFSGGGLVEEGLKGIIDPVLAVEYDEKISGVYRNNFGQHIVTADVRDVDPKELVKQIDGEVEYFHASPVCKNYSQAKSNHAEVELDKETAASTAEFINAVKPKVVTIENVKGYKDSDAMKIITDALDANGYTWDADVYNAADYGGYTNRERLIVRAVRDGKLPAKPEKMARKSGWYEAVADIIPTLTEKKNGVAPWMDIRLKADGIDWRNIDKPLYVMGSAYADGKVPHAFADELLPTLRTKSGDVIVMPDGKVYRAMGRVLARVSGVSDDYKMPFSESLSHTIIGNGIPTQLTEHVIAPLLTGSDPKFSIRTYHGTGASFDKFDLSHALEGEGSETFGHGVYVTNSSKIGREYAQRAKQRKMADLYKNMRYPDGVKDDIFKRRVFGEMVNDVATGGSVASAKEFAKKRVGADANDIQRTLENLKDREKGTEYEQNLKDRLAEYKDALKWIDSIDEDYLTQGNANRYDVDIPDDNGNYLGWNDSQNFPLEKWYRLWEITHHGFNENEYFKDGGARYDKDRIERIIQMKLDSPENGMQRLPTLKGEELYHALEDFFDRERPSHGAELASRALSEIGFVGIKYPAGLIHGGAEEGDYNYVIFDENNANIVGNTRFSLRYDQFEHDLNQWKKDNNLPKDAQRPTIPQRNAGESAVDFLRRVDEYRKQMALWKTAPTYEQHLLSDDTALGEFNRELQRGSVLKRIAFQDSMLAIRKAQEAIMKEVGVDRLNMAEDAYTAENRSHGKGKNEFEEYNNEFLQPLRKAYHQMKKVLGDSYDNVRIYMMAKHGLERDAQMAFKKSLDADFEDVAQRSAAYKAYKGDMNRIINDSDLEFGRVDFNTWRQRDNALRTKYSPSYMDYRYDENGIVSDYSGLSQLLGGSDFEEAAYKLVKDIEDKYVTETHNLWDATNAATKKILRDGYKAGMMSKDTYQYVRDMYSHYIPLRGWDGTTADQVWDYIGGGKGAFNQTLKKAHGRTSIADDPIAYIENMAESGILLNNKNWVKQHLMLLAQNHPTSLLTLSKAWYVKSVDDNGNEEWIPATPQITSQMNSNQVKAAIDAFEKKMEQMAQAGDATQKRDGLNIAYPQTHSEEREHEVRVMKDGDEYVIYVNGDPQLAQAMNNTRAHRVSEGIKNSISKRVIAVVGRKMAAAYTSLSPLFIPSNYFRDLTMTLASTAIREDAKYNYLLRKNLATSWNLGFMLRDFQNGKLRDKVNNGNATPKEQMFYDFMMNGGETGFVSSLDVEDLKKKFKNDLKDLDRWKANPVKVGHTIMDSIEFLNRAIEDSNRFAVYMTSIQYGRSIDEAVNDAKDVTLNFNRKGTGEHSWQTIRNLYLFINPAVQSLQTLGALAKHHPFKFTAVTASWLASGVLVPIVNVALMQLGAAFLGGDGDDDKDWYKDISKKYWQFSKWDRRNNFIMWVPTTHEFVKIPLAQEFRAFYGLGDMIASKMMGGELAEESWEDYGWDLVGQVVDMLPLDPTGYDGNIAVSLMPNAIRPVFELAFNVDFTGKPLFKDTEYNKYDPNFTKAYVGTPDWLVRVSKMVNSIGNDYPDVQQNSIDAFGDPRYNLNNPAVVDHVLSSYLGGAYTMGSQILGVLTKSLNDPKEIKVADIPLVSKFVSNPDDRPVTKKQGDEFWDMKENHDRAANTLSKLKKQAKVDGDYSMLERFYGSEEYKKYKQDDVKVKKYEEDKKKERAEESGEEYRPHKLNAEDIYKSHATPKDDFEDLKLKQLYTKLNGFKTSYDLLVDTAPSQSDGYYNTNKAAIDAIDEISLDKQEISELKKGFLDDGKDAYNAEDMKQIRELRKKILAVLEKANKVVVANQKAKSEK